MDFSVFVEVVLFFFLMIRRPPRSTQSRSSAASDVYKRQVLADGDSVVVIKDLKLKGSSGVVKAGTKVKNIRHVSYTHLRAHETVLDLVCRLLLEKKNKKDNYKFANHQRLTTTTETIT